MATHNVRGSSVANCVVDVLLQAIIACACPGLEEVYPRVWRPRRATVELKQLRLHDMAGAWADLVEQGSSAGLDSSRWLIEHLLEVEGTDRATRSVSDGSVGRYASAQECVGAS